MTEPSALGVFCDLASKRLDRAANDVDTDALVTIGGLDGVERLDGAQQRHTAARQNAFLDRRAGCVKRVVDAVLLLLHLDLRRAADADDGNAARELGKALLQLLAVVVGGGFFDLSLDLGHTTFDVRLGARTVDDCGVLLLDRHLLGTAEHVERDGFELDAEIFGDDGA